MRKTDTIQVLHISPLSEDTKGVDVKAATSGCFETFGASGNEQDDGRRNVCQSRAVVNHLEWRAWETRKFRHVKIMQYTHRSGDKVQWWLVDAPLVHVSFIPRDSARRDPRQSGTAPWTRDDAGSATRDTMRSLQRTPSQLPARLPHYGSPHPPILPLARRCTNWYHYATSKYVYRLGVYRLRNMNDGVPYPDSVLTIVVRLPFSY